MPPNSQGAKGLTYIDLLVLLAVFAIVAAPVAVWATIAAMGGGQ